MEGNIEDTVDLNENYPSVTERYWTKYYFIPKDKKKPGSNGGESTDRNGKGDMEGSEGVEGKGDAMRTGNVGVEERSESMEGKGTTMEKGDMAGSGNIGMEVDSECVEGNAGGIGTGDAIKDGNKGLGENVEGNAAIIGKRERNGGSENVDGNVTKMRKGEGTEGGNGGSENVEGNARTTKHGEEDVKMEVENDHKNKEGLKDRSSPQEKVDMRQGKWTYSSLDTSGHVCVMVHTNKLCLVTLSPKHPALAPGQKITEVSYNVGKFNRLDNQVSGKGKRGAQMMGPQSIVCIITCADGSRHGVLAGIHGKLVEVNERLVNNPQLLSERTDAEGYLAIILPPIRNGDAPLNRLITAQEYWAMDKR